MRRRLFPLFFLAAGLLYFSDLVKTLIFPSGLKHLIFYYIHAMRRRVFTFFLLYHYSSDLVKAFSRVRMNVYDIHYLIYAHACCKIIYFRLLYFSDLVRVNALIFKWTETSMLFFSLYAHTQIEIKCLLLSSLLQNYYILVTSSKR